MADEKPKVKKKSPSGKKSVNNENSAKKKQLEAAIRSQVAAEEKAHLIVEKLVLENVEENYFLEIGNYITPSHYADITEERALAKVCGYPLCTNTMPQILQQKYKISVQTNRVFDIAERKHFCSNQCYKASKFFESQIPTSPVWTRSNELPKEFTLLKTLDQSSRLGAGELLVGSESHHLNPSEEDLHSTQEDKADNEYNCDDITAGLNELGLSTKPSKCTEELRCEGKTQSCKDKFLSKDHNSCDSTKNLSTVRNSDFKAGQNLLTLKNEKQNRDKDKQIRDKDKQIRDKDNQIRDKDNQIRDKDKQISNSSMKIAETKDVLVKFIKETLQQWFTLSSFQYLNISTAGTEHFEEGSTEDDFPSYTERALGFLRPNKNTNITDDNDDDDIVKTKSFSSSEDVTITERENPVKDFPCIVPPIDSKAQLTIRRQILLQKFKQLLPEMLSSTQFNTRDIEDHFVRLVKTFKLTSQNVMFKPIEWRGLTATLLYLIHKQLYSDGIKFPSQVETKNAVFQHLELTDKDMNDIISLLIDSSSAAKHGDCLAAPQCKDQGIESYSLMEELD